MINIKKKWNLIVVFMVISVTIGCENSIKKDAKLAADFQCKMDKLEKKYKSGDERVVNEGKLLRIRIDSLAKQIEKKYPYDSDHMAEFQKELLLSMQEDCK